ncbi:5'-3' exonuclease PLD3-like isoform X2 [Homalodisca vitripennis]|uniref:5'-3' exonuclease PLD3-like isoform X2 n=1 Tax=Homalodisca vitripennis TaxID=197043 RepID=UPI001EEC64D3|nr:5'-3' exonuclease PLD3-like isoform X2 [Homalodisca vitripennis]
MTIITVPGKNKKQILDRGTSLPSDDYDDWESRYMMRTDFDDFGDKHNEMWGQKGWFKPSCVPISIILVLIVLVVLLPLLDHADRQAQAAAQVDWDSLRKCQAECRFSLVESIPDGMSYRNGTTPYPSTFAVWSEMLAKATATIEIASYYWTLTDGTAGKFPTGVQGQQIFDAILLAGTKRKLTVKIAQNYPSQSQPNKDTEVLVREKAAEVRSLNFPRLIGSGILHTKLWLVDRRHAYIGSANSDWRSLTEVKEMGIYVQDCPCVTDDIGKLFDVYWMMGAEGAQIPDKWPDSLSTPYNEETPMNLSTNGLVYLSSSPPQFCTKGRTGDGNAITSTILKANKFIFIAVMDYFPTFIYTSKPRYWADIDTALRTAALDNSVEIRLLVSWWSHSRESEKLFLRSLTDISDGLKVNITVKLFVVPSTAEQRKIPYARVNHNKYMVTDNTAYIGTSNWSGDYFTVTGGVGVVVEGITELRQQLEEVFLRDWNSEFAYNLPR